MKFTEQGHTYHCDDQGAFRSVTGILSLLQPKKDWDKIAAAYAKKNNIPVEEVKQMWQHEKDISLHRGTKFHASREREDLSLPFAAVFSADTMVSLEVVAPCIVDGVKLGQEQKLKEGVYPELLVWLNSIKVAGQVDRAEIYDNNINIIDYKTNKKMEIEGWKNRFGMSEKMLAPCGHLDNTDYWKYALQLNFYAYMIQRHNPTLGIGKLILRHVLFEKDAQEPHGHKDYEVPNLQKEIFAIVTHIKNKKL